MQHIFVSGSTLYTYLDDDLPKELEHSFASFGYEDQPLCNFLWLYREKCVQCREQVMSLLDLLNAHYVPETDYDVTCSIRDFKKALLKASEPIPLRKI